jgi:hypothetical protein
MFSPYGALATLGLREVVAKRPLHWGRWWGLNLNLGWAALGANLNHPGPPLFCRFKKTLEAPMNFNHHPCRSWNVTGAVFGVRTTKLKNKHDEAHSDDPACFCIAD